jgi:ABC-type transport system involved in cytochrome c biogenesis permease subunit
MALSFVVKEIYKKERQMKKWVIPILVGLVSLFIFAEHKPLDSTFDFNTVSKFPVLHNGRVKPLDSVARQSLIVISGKQTVKVDGEKLQATPWLFDVISNSKKADSQAIFFIHNPDLKTLLGITDITQKYFSFLDLIEYKEVLKKQSESAKELKEQQRSVYQKALVNLYDRLYFYHKLKNSVVIEGIDSYTEYFTNMERISDEREAAVEKFENRKKLTMKDKELFNFLNKLFYDSGYSKSIATFFLFPKMDEDNDWESTGESIQNYLGTHDHHPMLPPLFELLTSYQTNNAENFNISATALSDTYSKYRSSDVSRAKFEYWFNAVQPFYKSIVLYLISFLFVSLSWIFLKKPLYLGASHFLKWALFIHTFGLISRMILQWRPPVTNLYSSAIFVGWIAVIIGIYLEKYFRNKMGIFIASFIGFLTLIIAHHLSLTGSDTMEMMQAVLDSNFWLSTHVVTISIGYSATYLAGFLGIVYIFRDKFSSTPNDSTQKELLKMTFGIVCFSLFFSFVGTVLGGIWADQSWGRFWGWDPKENGALMIVLWGAIMLHSRLGGIIKEKGFMVAAVFGNIITSFSWFGVNMLGVGLHSYGFMDKTFLWLLAFVLTQLTIIMFGLIPSRR